ncbi:hypothetical protein D9M72_607120 [compost metagenome]
MSVLTLLTAANSAATAASSVSSASASRPAVSSWVTDPVPRAASAVGPSSSKIIFEPISTLSVDTWSREKPPISKSAWLLPLASTAAPFSISTRL